MKRIGLTGGIASGKSTVARLLLERGVPVIDADQIARQVVAPGSEGLQAIARRWPQAVREGALDRKALGAIVFADPRERRALEAITHPLIRAEAARRFEEAQERGEPLVVYEAALLFENDLDRDLDGTLLVAAPPAAQIERMRSRDGLSQEAAEARLSAQLPLEEKRRRATWVLENDRDRATLERRLVALWSEIEGSR